VPEKLNALANEKRYLSAVELLQDSLKSIHQDGMDEIGALSTLRVFLANQKLVNIPRQTPIS